jgi:hypothetical protein
MGLDLLLQKEIMALEPCPLAKHGPLMISSRITDLLDISSSMRCKLTKWKSQDLERK